MCLVTVVFSLSSSVLKAHTSLWFHSHPTESAIAPSFTIPTRGLCVREESCNIICTPLNQNKKTNLSPLLFSDTFSMVLRYPSLLPTSSFVLFFPQQSFAVQKVHFVPLSKLVMHKCTPALREAWCLAARGSESWGKCTYTNVITSYLCLSHTFHPGKWWQDKMKSLPPQLFTSRNTIYCRNQHLIWWTLPNVIYFWPRGAEPKAALCVCLTSIWGSFRFCLHMGNKTSLTNTCSSFRLHA